jgi:hypothetical protein
MTGPHLLYGLESTRSGHPTAETLVRKAVVGWYGRGYRLGISTASRCMSSSVDITICVLH